MAFLLSEFVEGKVTEQDLGSNDFELPDIDDSFTYSGSNGSNTQNDEEEDSESSIKVHDSYDDTNDLHTSLVSTNHVTIIDDGDDDGSGE